MFFNELKEKKTYAGKNGPWSPTHSINMIVDGTRVGLGLTEKTTLRAKDIDDQYQDVTKGAEVSIVVEEGEEYKGQKQYNSKSSQITVISVGAPQQTQQQSGNKPDFTPRKRDNTGVETGHALNGGMNLTRNQVLSDVVEAAEIVHSVTTTLKKEYAEKNPDMSEYDVGAMVGNAVLNATRNVDDVDQLIDTARYILDEIVPKVSAIVKGEVKKPVAKQTPKREQAEPESDAYDDDIPF